MSHHQPQAETQHKTKTQEHKNAALEALSSLQLVALIPDQKEVVFLNSEDSLEKCVKTLTSKKFLSLPVKDKNLGFIGFVDVLDIASFIVGCAPNPSELRDDELKSLTIAGRAISLIPISRLFSKYGINFKTPSITMYDSSPAHHAIDLFAKGVHRTAVLNEKKELCGVVSQLDMVKWLVQHLNQGKLKSLGEKSIKSFGYGICEVYTIASNVTVLSALQKLALLSISSLAVVDPKTNVLVGNFSASDLSGLYQEKFPHLLSTVEKFLEEHSPGSLKPVCANIDASLYDNVKILTQHNFHHLWVVDKDNKPVGILSLTDIASIVANTKDIY